MATLQVKGMDDRLYGALRRRAEMDDRSISQEVIHIVRNFLAKPTADIAEASDRLLELAGSWEDDRPAEEIAADMMRGRKHPPRFTKELSDAFD
jgi:plasmid stability protein